MANYQILTDIITTKFKQHKSEFYVAKEFLTNYTKPIALLGTRRTGKTVTLQQLFCELDTHKKQYIRFLGDANKDDLLELSTSSIVKESEFLFIDEITNIPALDFYLGDFLDLVECLPCKIVMAGTNSLLLTEAIPSSASGRLKVVNYNPPNYSDYKNILGANFSQFMLGDVSFYNGPKYIEDLSKDIYRAMDLVSANNYSSLDIPEEDIQKTLEILIEQIINKSTGLHRDSLLFKKTLYSLKMNVKEYEHIIKSEHFKIITMALIKMNLFNLIVNEDLTNSDDKSMNLYLTTPVLFKGLLNKYDKVPLETKEGDIFESIAVTQLLYKLQKYKVKVCKLREPLGAYEIDLVIIDETNKNIFFIDFKRSSNKSIQISQEHQMIIENFYSKFQCKYHYYTVYLLDKENRDYIKESSFQIDYFLDNLESILKFTNKTSFFS